jgi:uncharacterized membrane-anchored protein
MTTNNPKPIALWRFVLPLLLQMGLIIVIPIQAVYILLTGRTVILQTRPVDPYDLLRGYSQTLSYDISDYQSLEKLPGADSLKDKDNPELKNGTKLYVVLEEGELTNKSQKIPPTWKAVKLSKNLPNNLQSNQVALQGYYEYNRIKYNLETYYFPESQREEINNAINNIQWQQGEQRPFVVEVKIDSNGKAIPISLWVGDSNYRF